MQPSKREPIEMLEEVVADLEKTFGTWQVKWGDVNRLQRTHTSGEEPFSDQSTSLPIAGGPGDVGSYSTSTPVPAPGQKMRYGVAGTFLRRDRRVRARDQGEIDSAVR
jgi:acyl-homoserine lactone acylase PvdQ